MDKKALAEFVPFSKQIENAGRLIISPPQVAGGFEQQKT